MVAGCGLECRDVVIEIESLCLHSVVAIENADGHHVVNEVVRFLVVGVRGSVACEMGSAAVGLDCGGEEKGCDVLERDFDAEMDCDGEEKDCVVLMGCVGALMGCGALTGSCVLMDCVGVATFLFCPCLSEHSVQPKLL
mmetsp:Transcript_125085/g.195999  ORF Transcript_125085/g.195999 Transcript_125085/m.195999 type:complete len:139 (-) Transcript_125085:339-755(-)